jgi:drug/metabolite transporter (DMT)-like permease
MPSLSRFRSIPITVSARRKGLVIMLASAGIFAVMGLLMKLLGPEYRVWDIAIYRFVGGAVILGALFRFNRHLLRPARPRLMLVRGVVGSIAFLSITYAIRSIPFSTAMVLFYSFPAFAALFSTCISPERLSLYEIICILAALVGVGVIFDFRPEGDVIGQAMAVLGAVFAGLTVAIIKDLRRDHGPVMIYFYFCVIGSCICIVPFMQNPQIPFHGPDLMIVGGILASSIVAQILMNQGFSYCKSWEGGLFMTSEVVFAALLGVLFLGESVTWRLLAGGLLIFAGGAAIRYQFPRGDHPPRTTAHR